MAWPLRRIEQRGLFDLALFLLAGAQWLLLRASLREARLMDQLIMNPRQVTVLLVFSLLTWSLLALGAVAQLKRNRVTGRGELPPGSGPCLAGYALMALIWLVLLFNINPYGLWGFWHIVRLEPEEAGVAIAVLPLALAPVWWRGARLIRLQWLHRRRATRRIQSPWLWPALAAATLCVYAWFMTDRAVMSDGWGMIAFSASPHELDSKGYREAGSMLLFQFVQQKIFRYLSLNPMQTIGLINFAAMLGALGMAAWMLRLLRLAPTGRRLGWWLIFSSLGVTQMLLGRIELYPLVQFFALATLAAGFAALWAGHSPAWMSLAFALGLAAHLSLVFLLPAVLLMVWFWAKSSQSEDGVFASKRSLPRGLAHLFGWGTLVHLPWWCWLMLKLDDPTPRGLILALSGSLNTGASLQPFVWDRFQSMTTQLVQLFSVENLFKMVQLFFYLAGGALMVGFMILVYRLSNKRRVDFSPDSRDRRQSAILLTALLGYTVYAFVWRAQWGWDEDWDLFSGLAPLLALFMTRYLTPGRGRSLLPPVFVRSLCLFALTLGLTQHYFYHTRATYLNNAGKINMDTVNGPQIQLYQLRHGWQRGTIYSVINGEVQTRDLADFDNDPAGLKQP